MNYRTLAVTALFLMTLSSSAFALGNRGLGPMIDVGGGIASVGEAAALLRVNVIFGAEEEGRAFRSDDWLRGDSYLFLAHINGDIAFVGDGADLRVPYFNIDFAPIDVGAANRGFDRDWRDPGEYQKIGIELLPTEITRDVRLDQSLVVRVSVIKIGIHGAVTATDRDEKLLAYASLAAEALGYKTVSHFSEASRFSGLHLGGVEGRLGARWMPSEKFSARVELGGSADITFGDQKGLGLVNESDLKAYLALKADIGRWLELFVEAERAVTYGGSEVGFISDTRLLGGATFIF